MAGAPRVAQGRPAGSQPHLDLRPEADGGGPAHDRRRARRQRSRARLEDGLSQDTTIADTAPRRAASHWHITLGIRDNGIIIGNAARTNGLRINFADADLEVVNGVNFTLWKPREPLSGTVNGIAIGIAGPGVEELNGIGIGIAGVVAEHRGRWVMIGGLGAVSNGRLEGLIVGGLGAVANGDVEGIAISGLGTVANQDFWGFAVAGLGTVVNRDLTGAGIGGLATVANGSLAGVGVGGLATVVNRDITGIGVGGVATVANGSLGGIGVGGLATVVNGDMTGLGFGGLATVANGDARGVSIGGLASVTGGSLRGVGVSVLATVATDRLRGVGLAGSQAREDPAGYRRGVIAFGSIGYAIPAALAPIEIEGRLLVDGGIAMNLPVDVAREMGAGVVIAVDISSDLLSRDTLRSVVDITTQLTNLLTRTGTIEQRERLTAQDLLVIPQFDAELSSVSFARMRDAVQSGYDAVMQRRAEFERLALGEEAYAAHLAARKDPRMPELPAVEFVHLDNHAPIAASVAP